MRLCTNCETMVEDSRARLCPNCGAALPGASMQVPPPVPSDPLMQMQRPPQSSSSGSQIVRALLIAALVIVGIGVLLFLGLLLLCGVIGKGGGFH